MLTKEDLEKNWPEIKRGLRNLWRGLSADELESGKGNIFDLTETIQKKSGDSKTEINQKLHKLLNSFDNETDKGLDPDVSSYKRTPC